MTICLNMIVKDEAAVIARCLRSVRHLVDYWVIVDTGSTDTTREIILQEMASLPGELYERTWVDFGHNRTEALQLAAGKADYTLTLDADEVLEAPAGFAFPALDKDSYLVRVELGSLAYARTLLLKSALPWRYEGVVHEYPDCAEAKTRGQLDGLVNRPRYDGARSKDPQKYAKDAELLRRALEKDPSNARNVFYLAQSYRDAGKPEKALETYQRRAAMGGWEEEVWYSLFQVAVLSERLKHSHETIVCAYLAAYQYRPTRAESMCELARYLRSKNLFALAVVCASVARGIERCSDILFVDSPTYEWKSADEYAISGYWTGAYQQAAEVNRTLLARGKLPVAEVPRILKNLAFCEAKIRGTDYHAAKEKTP